MNDFFKAIRSYLLEYLPKQKCCSPNTIKSYRNTLNIFVNYLRIEKKLKISQINFELFNRSLFLEFLNWLENARNCAASTRNQRLMALRAFFKYAGIIDCTQIASQQEIEDVPFKKEQGRIVDFLSEEALKTLLNQPDTTKRIGLRNQFLMVLMYDTAARCSEILNLKVQDLRINTGHPTAYLLGKGNKPRLVPLLSKTVEHYKRYLAIFHPNKDDNDYLFYTVVYNQKRPMSIDNVEFFMKNYGEKARLRCPEIPERVHPHQLRHTRAIHYYRDGMPLALLSELLNHTNPETTKIYAYADTEMKRAAMEKAEQVRKGVPLSKPIWKDNEEMILELSGLKATSN